MAPQPSSSSVMGSRAMPRALASSVRRRAEESSFGPSRARRSAAATDDSPSHDPGSELTLGPDWRRVGVHQNPGAGADDGSHSGPQIEEEIVHLDHGHPRLDDDVEVDVGDLAGAGLEVVDRGHARTGGHQLS